MASPITHLPDEILLQMFSYLPKTRKTFLQLSSVSSAFHRINDTNMYHTFEYINGKTKKYAYTLNRHPDLNLLIKDVRSNYGFDRTIRNKRPQKDLKNIFKLLEQLNIPDKRLWTKM